MTHHIFTHCPLASFFQCAGQSIFQIKYKIEGNVVLKQAFCESTLIEPHNTKLLAQINLSAAWKSIFHSSQCT